jgi:hypothetical protein
MDNVFLELLGYLASVLIVISLLMKSFIRFRFINLIGSLFFVIYSLLYKTYPVALLNSFSVIFNVYFILQFLFRRDYFKMLKCLPDAALFIEFLSFYKNDILKYFPSFFEQKLDDCSCYYILRNMKPSGIFVFRHNDDESADIIIDYVTAEFRDAKIGKFIYKDNLNLFLNLGIKSFNVKNPLKLHLKYLEKMDFKKIDDNIFKKINN